MKKIQSLKDLFFLTGVAFFFFGCIASMHRTARITKPKQVSMSGSYMQARTIEEFDDTPVQLYAFDVRTGIAKRADIGFMHTWDASKDNENAFASVWGDFKVQLSNLDNRALRPSISTGLIKGYAYKESTQLHFTSLPILFSMPVNKKITPFFNYRYELISDDFMPESMENPRHMFAFGAEVKLTSSGGWQPTLNFCVGRYNGIDGGDNPGLIFNAGFVFDSPIFGKN